MDAERKMICTMADNAAGGVSRAVLSADHLGMAQEVTMLNWVLGSGQKFEEGAIYGVAVWLISRTPAGI